MPFARVGVSSGARVKNTKLTKQAEEVMTGDIICPEGFQFGIECKKNNIKIDFFEKSALLNGWLQQVLKDAMSVNKWAMLCIKRPHQSWLVAIPVRALPLTHASTIQVLLGEFEPYMIRGGWLICKLEALLRIKRTWTNFWFEGDNQ